MQRQMRLDGGVFKKLLAGPRIILLLQVREPKIEMHEGKLGILLSRRLKFRESRIVLPQVQMILSGKEMVFRRAVSEFNQLRGGPVVEILPASPVSGVREHVHICHS